MFIKSVMSGDVVQVTASMVALISAIMTSPTLMDTLTMGFIEMHKILSELVSFSHGIAYRQVVKIIAVVGGLILTAAGLKKPMSKLLEIVQNARAANDLFDEVNELMSTWLGFSLATGDLGLEFQRRIDRMNIVMAKPTSDFKGDVLTQAIAEVEENRQYLIDNRHASKHALFNTYVNLVNSLDERIRTVKQDWASRKSRPDPVGLYLYSRIPGLGKTAYARFITQCLGKRIKNFNTGIYSIQPGSNHFANYYGEHVMHIDEAGNVRNEAARDSVFMHINNIMSSNAVPMPTAALEGKNQIPKPLLVIVTTNVPFNELRAPLREAAHQALLSRFIPFEVQDPLYDPHRANACTDQPHRRPDFTHLQFRTPERDVVNTGFVPNRVAEAIARNLANYRALTEERVPDFDHIVFEGEAVDATKRLKYIKKCKEQLRKRWVNEYLKALAERKQPLVSSGGTTLKNGNSSSSQSESIMPAWIASKPNF